MQLQLDSSIEIVTPENIAFRYEVAGPFRRLPAFVIDLVIRFAVCVAAMFVMGFVGLLGGFPGVGILLLMWFVLEWFYGGLFETYWNGQTPGKRTMGIRVLSENGQPINGLQAVMRNILRFADLMPVLPLSALGAGETPLGIPTCLIRPGDTRHPRAFSTVGRCRLLERSSSSKIAAGCLAWPR